MKKEFLNNPDECLKLKTLKSKQYNDEQYISWSDEKFCDWFFVDYDFYAYDKYIEISSLDDKYKEESIINFKNKQYIQLQVFTDTDNPYNPITTLYFGEYFLARDFISIDEALKFNKGVEKLDIDFLEKLHIFIDSDCVEEKYFQTSDDFYGNYIIDDNICCEGILFKNNSNLDLWHILLSGNDDYSITSVFLSEEEAKKQWDLLKNKKTILKTDLKNHWFSN
jgi:hypothetical protein